MSLDVPQPPQSHRKPSKPSRKPERDVKLAFLRKITDEKGYPPDRIQWEPEYRVKERPSDPLGYPVDIAVFSGPRKLDDDLFIIVETKQPRRADGERQLKVLLRNSAATVGLWYNGDDHLYIEKRVEAGRTTFPPLRDFPRFGQSLHDLGRLKRSDLRKPVDIRRTFRGIHNHLAASAKEITRESDLAEQVISLLFCKVFDEIQKAPDDDVEFCVYFREDPKQLAGRIGSLFERVKAQFHDVFDAEERITLDAESLAYVVGEFEDLALNALIEEDIDAVADAFEVFIGPSLRGEKGQFFTPRNVVRMVMDVVDPRPDPATQRVPMLIDPACGSGGFLIEALKRLWRRIDEDARRKTWTTRNIMRMKEEAASSLFGIEKDRFLAKTARKYMALLGNGRQNIVCANSLDPPADWAEWPRGRPRLGGFDLVITNPPHGSRLLERGEQLLRQYELASRWKAVAGSWESTGILRDKVATPILFLERCVRLLREGGTLVLVVPETYLGMPNYGWIPQWLLRNLTVRAVVAMPEDLFQPYTHNKVCVLIAERRPPTDGDRVFLASVRFCGRDSRGRPAQRDEVPEVTENLRTALREGDVPVDGRLGRLLPLGQLKESILIPKYYDPGIAKALQSLEATHDLTSIGDLRRRGLLRIDPGVEVGKEAYGTGNIPFVRTSDLANWEVKMDPKQGISEGRYLDWRTREPRKTDMRPGDILMVRDGTYLVGTTALLTDEDIPDPGDPRMLYQAELLRLRISPDSGFSPPALLVYLNLPIVKAQIRSKRFTRGVIDTLGPRVDEILLPVPKDPEARAGIESKANEIVENRAKYRRQAIELVRRAAPVPLERE